jgi:predicted site-specific integrase-resolvase
MADNHTENRVTIGYARVSTREQKPDLETQKQVLESYCRLHFGPFEIISDLGSGMNYHKRGLRRLLERLLNDEVGRLVITNKDRLLRFGSELVFAICEIKGIEVVIINKGDVPSFEEELVQDVLEIITVFEG